MLNGIRIQVNILQRKALERVQLECSRLFLPILFLLIVYFMAGLRINFAAFFLTMLTVFLSIVAAQGLGLAIGAILMDVKRATTHCNDFHAGGFFVKRALVFISWLRYISFNYHTYRLLLKVQYDNITLLLKGLHPSGSGFNEVIAMFAMVIGYRIIAYLSLRRMKHQ